MSHFAQTQCAGQACTAFERVQIAQHLVACAAVFRPRGPLAQRRTQRGQQFRRLFLEDRKQINVNGVEHIDVIVDVLHKTTVFRNRWQRGHQCGDFIFAHLIHLNRLNRFRGYQRLLNRIFLRIGLCITRRLLLDVLNGVGLRFVGAADNRRRQFMQEAVQAIKQLHRGFFEESGGKLMEETTNVFGRIHEQLRLLFRGRTAFALVKRNRTQRVLQGSGDIRQRLEANGR